MKYHDEEWGVPLHNDNKLFEFLVLGGFQAGLTWWLILQRREILREAFDSFKAERIANYSEKDIERIMNTSGMIRNRQKISAAIVNAQQFIKLGKEFGSFDSFIWSFVGDKKINNTYFALSDLPSESPESIIMSRELKSRGFKFVGPIICYAFMQATGLVNDHLVSCYRHNQVKDMR